MQAYHRCIYDVEINSYYFDQLLLAFQCASAGSSSFFSLFVLAINFCGGMKVFMKCALLHQIRRINYFACGDIGPRR